MFSSLSSSITKSEIILPSTSKLYYSKQWISSIMIKRKDVKLGNQHIILGLVLLYIVLIEGCGTGLQNKLLKQQNTQKIHFGNVPNIFLSKAFQIREKKPL